MNEPFKGHWEDIILDEIALEGLDGLTLDGLWVRLSVVFDIRLPLPSCIRKKVWNYILDLPEHVEFFIIPKPRPCVKILQRNSLQWTENESMEVEDCPSRAYKYNPIEDNNIMGSCEFYKERVKIENEEIKDLTLEDVNKRWADKFVIVAVQHMREQALIRDTHNPTLPKELKVQAYCTLEKIGRSREYGEATIGKHSLLNIASDSTLLFYLKSRLSNLHLIRKQPYLEKSQAGSLLQLARFTSVHEAYQFTILADSITFLKNRSGIATHAELRDHLSKHHGVSVKKLFLTQLFKKYISSDTAFYREVYPNAPASQYAKKSNKNQEKILKVLRLIDMNVRADEIFEEDEAEDEETAKVFLNKDNLYMDMSFDEQVYEHVKAQGAQGIAQSHLAKFLGLQKLCMRRLIKKLLIQGRIGFYLKDEGRQRMNIYVARQYLPSIDENMVAQKQPVETIGVEPGPSHSTCDPPTPEKKYQPVAHTPEKVPAMEVVPETPTEYPTSIEILDKNESDFKMVVKENGFESLKQKRYKNLLTKRQRLRRDTVIELTREKNVIDTIHLVRYIINYEHNMGCRDRLCRKSLNRLLLPLYNERAIKMYDVRMEWREYVKVVRLVCESNVHIQHEILHRELGQIKESFFSSISLKRRRNQNDNSIPITRRVKSKKLLRHGDQKTNERVGSAKYVRAKLVHEILFHLLYVLKPDQQPIPFSEAANAWKEFDLSIDANEMQEEVPPVYSTDVNWTMFLSPLPEYDGFPPGWICLKDFLMQIPLSIYVKLHRIKAHTDVVIQEYLKHPIRKFYTIRGLPLQVRDFIHLDSSYVRTVEEILRLLGQMALVQFGPRMVKETIQNFVYLNRNGIILDTTSSDPGYSRVSDDREYPLLHFTFNTTNDVTEFWMTLQNVCMATKLGYVGKRDRTEEVIRPVMKPLPEVAFDEAPKRDVGYLVGNKLGAGGLDWKLFAHKSRNWDLSYSAHPKQLDLSKLRPRMRYTAFKAPQRGVRQIFFKRVKKQVVVKKVHKIIYDDVDKECIQRMDQLRVRWDEKEDRLLMICRVVNTFLQGSAGYKAMTAFIFRDIMQWNLQSMQKSSRSCQRRILYLMRNKTNVNQINSWLNELYQNEYINRTYGSNFFVELRKLFPSIEGFSNAAKIYFLQLFCSVNQLLLNKATIQHSASIPDTLQQFGLLYRKSLDNSTMLRHFDPKSVEEVNESTINLLIHSSVCSQRDKMLYNVQLFEIYRSYDEGMIERCFRKVRIIDQLVVAGKMMSKQKFPLLGKKVCISNVYRQQFYLLIPYLIYEQCFNSFGTMLENHFRPADRAPLKYTCVNSGTSILLMELTFLPGCHVDIQIPKQVLKFDPAQVQSTAHTPDKTIDHFHRIVEEKCPNTQYTKDIPTEKVVATTKKTQFNINVSVHKIVYNPYDTISRISDSQIHFFCALQHLSTTVSIEDIAHKPYNCPFRCVLQDMDYLGTIAKLITENNVLISQLFTSSKESTPAEAENAEHIKTTVFLDQTNIVQVANYIRDKIGELLQETHKKEIGVTRVPPRPVNIVQLAYDALKSDDLDGYVSDEEELLTERGENNQRYQDFLVVNAPTLSISFKDDEFNSSAYKDMNIPEYLLPGLNKKQDVLDKVIEDALWKYVDNSLEDLEKEMELDGFTDTEKALTKQVLNLIETYEFGISACELNSKFPDEKSVIKSLTILRKLYLIKRVGVEAYMYVHKMKVRPWIIHSFHIKRLERESMTPQGEINFEPMKRKNEEEMPEEPKSKKTKLQATASTSRGKRTLKSVSRYGSEPTFRKEPSVPTEKVNVHMRPSPWIRVNGTLNRRVFDKWMGTILLECTIRCTILVKSLFVRFHQLHPVNILLVLDCLKDLGCIELQKCVSGPVNLFTEDDHIEVSEASELSKAENMFVVALPYALHKMALFIGEKKYQIDF